ncbi:VWA domain-containing protein [Candidatus Saccharibacteria bacterium]|nr:VWA domain-containing protein [Candidatus Saccharibacteria bacterium]
MEEIYENAQITPNIDVNDIENDHMYLMAIALDRSGSMEPYESDMKKSMSNFVSSIQDSKSDDEMLVSITKFSSDITSSGFQNVADLDTSFRANGCTALYDAIMVASKQLEEYKVELNDTGVRTRGGLVIFSDGEDNDSKSTVKDAADTIKKLLKQEVLVAFVAFGADAHGIANSLGIPQENILETDASPSELRKIWGILSKSAISSSKSTAAGASQSSFFDI